MVSTAFAYARWVLAACSVRLPFDSVALTMSVAIEGQFRRVRLDVPIVNAGELRV